ncbi:MULTISPECIES: hypothetical protein [Microbacterium]|uniref:hypothetical protein n=1 Tax=Microbacterium TaxID=33882 RepID=UPI0018888B00|nr:MULTISPECIES: hypothetical protein [Microbacterium]
MNDELTPRERTEMRDLVLAGSQRIRPAGRHRTQFVAGALALALVAGITGGAIATAALLGSEAQPAPAVTPTPPAPTPTESATPPPTTPSPTPDPTPTTPSEPTPPAIDELVVSPSGLGPVRIGEPLADAGLLMAQLTNEDCLTTYWRTADRYVVADGGYGSTGGPAFTLSGDESGAIQRIDVLTPSIPTQAGLRIGMSGADVARLHPDAVEQPGALSNIWIVPGASPGGQLIIEVANSDVSYWGDAADTVAFIRVIDADAVPGTIAASDDVAGACRDPY